jgi:formylmethanofuran--tetrahydromethanopterin N-formyltransferase
VSHSSACEVEDTYAEAFRSLYAEILVTARDRQWLDHAVAAATGNASSTILCDCEAGLDRYVGPGADAEHSSGDSLATPDGRPGAVLQFHVPRFRKDRVPALERSLLVRISQNVLTCPTARCFNLIDAPPNGPLAGTQGGASETAPYFKLGRKLAFFGDGHQHRGVRFDRKVWIVPILGGEFVIDRRFGYRDGLMGGNLWFLGENEDAALDAAERAQATVARTPGVITPFPGGIAASGSKAGSRYSFMVGSTFAEYCPTLRDKLGARSRLPAGVQSVMEVIINGRDLPTIASATWAAIEAARHTPGLVKISAGNYEGRLGKSFVYLYPERQPKG